jgi:hypothetical protein
MSNQATSCKGDTGGQLRASPRSSSELRLDANKVEAAKAKKGTCRECGTVYQAQRTTREFCCTACRRTFHNRRALQGADFYDLFMAIRFDRDNAKKAGAWSLMCRMAASFKATDDRERNCRQSWDDIAKVKDRNSHLGATVVGVNVAGMSRPKGGGA